MFYAFRWFSDWTFATSFRKTQGHRIAELCSIVDLYSLCRMNIVQYVSYILLPPCFVQGKSHSDFQEDSRVWGVRGKAAFSKWASETAAARCSQCRDSTTHTHTNNQMRTHMSNVHNTCTKIQTIKHTHTHTYDVLNIHDTCTNIPTIKCTHIYVNCPQCTHTHTNNQTCMVQLHTHMSNSTTMDTACTSAHALCTH